MIDIKEEAKKAYKSFVAGEITVQDAAKQIALELSGRLTKVIFNIEGTFTLEYKINKIKQRVSLPYNKNCSKKKAKRARELAMILQNYTHGKSELHLSKGCSTKHHNQTLLSILGAYK